LLEFYLENKIFIGLGAELIAAIFAILLLRSGIYIEKPLRVFCFYVMGVFLADLFGGYVILAYFNEYKFFSFIKNTPFVMNHWWYNIVQFTGFLIFTYVLGTGIKKTHFPRILQLALVCFSLFSILRFTWLGDFFDRRDIGMEIAGTMIILLSSGLYLISLLRSNRILNFDRHFRFYVAIGASIFYLVFIPVEIYSAYFTELNPDFIEFHATILRYLNLFMYGLFCLGFFMHYRLKNKPNSSDS